MILVVGPNPAIDRTAVVDRLEFDTVLRPSRVLVQPGGKGLNVARAAHALGALVVSTGIVGGHGGRWLLEAAASEGLSPRFVETDVETRTTYVVLDDHGKSVLVYEPSGAVPASAVDELLALLERELMPLAERVVFAGSLPVGAPEDTYARAIGLARRAHRPSLLDTTGAALVAGISAAPDVVKVSLEEATGAGVAPQRSAALDAARAIVARGPGAAIVTDGARGAAASDGRTGWRIGAAPVDPVDTIGSGDAFTAGLLVALGAGLHFDEALTWGAAAGAANAARLGAGHLDPAVHAAAVPAVRLERLDDPRR